MDKIQVKRSRYSVECVRIANAMRYAGYQITMDQAEELWLRYSYDRLSSWMILPNYPDEIVACLQPYFDVED